MKDLFDERAEKYTPKRVALFNSANKILPSARETERELLIQRLELNPGVTVCDIAAGGGYLSEGIHSALSGQCRIICVENSRAFADSLPKHFATVICSLSQIALPHESVDRVACLAGIHHQKDKLSFFKEAHRILSPGGIIAVGDVLENSPTAHFLNIAVDRYSDLGHDGIFLKAGELTKHLSEAGFTEISEKHESYQWKFPDMTTLIHFAQLLFRMTKATPAQVQESLMTHLKVTESKSEVSLGWSLVYASGKKKE